MTYDIYIYIHVNDGFWFHLFLQKILEIVNDDVFSF